MKIAIDTSPLHDGNKGRGVGTYTKLLLNSLKQKKEVTVVESINPQAEDVDLVHYPYFDLFRPSLPIKKPKPTIVTIHDVIPLQMPDQFPKGIKGSVRLLHQKISIKNTKHIITDSEYSKKTITKYLSITGQRISDIPLVADTIFAQSSKTEVNNIKKKLDLPSKFYLYVGDIGFNKNLPQLINVFGKLKNENLAIVTRADINLQIPEAISIKNAIKQNRNNNVTIKQVSSQHQLAHVYSAAYFYIQPSLLEGFGLPVLEAMQTSTPVIASNTASLPEIAGQAGLYFTPTSQKSIINAINKSSSLPKRQYQKLKLASKKQATRFTSDKFARETIEVYKKVLNQ